jgi:predicted dehydrogenase
MSPKEVRAGIVGSGFAARFHYEALERVYGLSVSISGVYSPTAKHRDQYAAERNLAAYDSLEQLIEDCDVLHVCAPPASHEAVAVQALQAGTHVIIEKPFTGYFGGGRQDFDGDSFPREEGLEQAMASVRRLLDAERSSEGRILYAENWVYAPAVQKEREIIEKTGAQLIWMHGEEAHSGSHSPFYGIWSHSGGGSVMGKGVHPLTAALYLKKVEGRARGKGSIRPKRVSAQVHAVTRSPSYEDKGFLRTSYTDIEDFGHLHVVFEDGTFADVFASELVMGGVHNWIEVVANNHRGVVNINPNNAFETYNPEESQFDDVYVVEKIGTKQGWAPTSPDENWFTGYQHEMQAFYRNVADGTEPESDGQLAADTIAVVYAAYLSAERDGAAVDVPQA